MRKTRLDERGLTVGGESLPLYSGAVHYWRHRRDDWPRLLDGVREMGFRILETYVPWSVHEPTPGTYDFQGDRDIGTFLSLCEDRGLYVMVRPGPHINAEMTLFGYPEWILWDPDIQALSPQGTPVIYPHFAKPFPIPSYASDQLYVKTAEYFRALRPVLEPHVWPRGCIVAAQADNETCYFFRDAAYTLDYAPDSIRLYRTMLRDQYGDIGALNAAYHQGYASFDEVAPPSGYDPDCPVKGTDWVRYKENQVLWSVQRMARLLPLAGLEVATFHNCAFQHYTPVSLQRCEALPEVDIAGIDAYGEPDEIDMLQTRVRYLAGSAKLPFIPEFGSGSWFDRGCVLTPTQQEYAYLYAFMNGLKAVNFYMLAERDRWVGCPLRQDGQARPEYFSLFQNLLRLLVKTELHTYRREVPVLILKDYDVGRRKAAYSAANYAPFTSNCFVTETALPRELFRPRAACPGLPDDHLHQWWEEAWVDACAQKLTLLGLTYDLSDRYVPTEHLKRYPALLASVTAETDAEVQMLLLNAAREGADVAFGPQAPPLLQEALKGSSECRLGKGSLHWLPNPEAYATELRPRVAVRGAQVETASFVRDNQVLGFAANTDDVPARAVFTFEGARRWVPLWRGEPMQGLETAETVLAPHTVSLWRMECAG